MAGVDSCRPAPTARSKILRTHPALVATPVRCAGVSPGSDVRPSLAEYAQRSERRSGVLPAAVVQRLAGCERPSPSARPDDNSIRFLDGLQLKRSLQAADPTADVLPLHRARDHE